MPPKRGLQISRPELDVLRVLWREGLCSLREVFEQLAGEHAYTTVQTLLDRLVEKGLVFRDRKSRPARHRAKVTRTRVMRHYVGLMLENVCDGPGPLVLQLLRDESFSAEELAEINRVIGQTKARPKGDPNAPS